MTNGLKVSHDEPRRRFLGTAAAALATSLLPKRSFADGELDFPDLQGAFQITILPNSYGLGFAIDVPAGGAFRLTGSFGPDDQHVCQNVFPNMEVMVRTRLRIEYGHDMCTQTFTLLHVDRPVVETIPGGAIYLHRNAPLYPGDFSNWSQVRDAIIQANLRYGVSTPLPDHA